MNGLAADLEGHAAVVRVDILAGMGREIAAAFGVRAVPTTVVVNGVGDVVLVQAGIPDRGALRAAALGSK
ncbi:hypothetical protein ACFLYO_04480 [Chloroflexota bacterium]